ncbi:MAG: Ger(x)C family spore germination protein [Oscillospiraceae bacterium]|jgi:spore germination protein KC|nr:Ger(x)C family spore germination protein [Oscillospiraceae bacterium]
MKDTLRRAAVLSLAVFTLVSASSCRYTPHMTDIANFETIQIIGVDKGGEHGKEFVVTIVADRPAGEDADPVVGYMTVAGPTFTETMEKINTYATAWHHMGYVDYYLFGENAAKEDIGTYLDYIMRDYESRYSAQVFVVRDGTAAELIANANSKSASLLSMLEGNDGTMRHESTTETMRLIDLVNAMSTDHHCAVIPALSGKDFDFASTTADDLPKQIIVANGYAVIRDYKLTGYIDRDIARGYNMLYGKMYEAPVRVEDPDGYIVVLDVMNTMTEFNTTWSGDKLTEVEYKFYTYMNISEALGKSDILSEADLQYIGKQVSRVLGEEVQSVLDIQRENNVDLIEICERVRMKNPVKWAKIEDDWAEILPEVKVKFSIACTVRRSYDIKEPVAATQSGAEDKK